MRQKKTHIITVSRKEVKDTLLLPAAEAIKHGKIVVFPTETVYGVGCRYDDEAAKERIFALKKRESSKPLPIYLLSAAEMEKRSVMSEAARRLAEKFLPGPLTLVLPGRSGGSIGFRIPSDEVARRLISLAGIPLAGTSANLSGEESPVDGKGAIEAMQGRVDFIIDAGETELACESTVVDLSGDQPIVLREGAISVNELSRVLGTDVRAHP